jgi:hypothetical protein
MPIRTDVRIRCGHLLQWHLAVRVAHNSLRPEQVLNRWHDKSPQPSQHPINEVFLHAVFPLWLTVLRCIAFAVEVAHPLATVRHGSARIFPESWRYDLMVDRTPLGGI